LTAALQKLPEWWAKASQMLTLDQVDSAHRSSARADASISCWLRRRDGGHGGSGSVAPDTVYDGGPHPERAFFATLHRAEPGTLIIGEHLGRIDVHVQDLAERWDAEQAAERVELDPSRVFVDEVAEDLPAPPADVWQHLTDPQLRMEWQGLREIDEEVRSGRRGVGTRSHCVHESGSFGEQILDWRPFQHEAVRMAMPRMGSVVATYDLEAVPGGTRLRYRCGEPRGLVLRLMRPMVARQMRRMSRGSLVRLRSMLEDSTAQSGSDRASMAGE
jgi:uncharacterized protein YndB with AHSA1/START domain